MYAGMRTLAVPSDPVARLWHAATMLREHRGHVGGDDAAVVWDGSAAVVPLLVGTRGGLGSSDPGRGARFHPVAAGHGQAGSAALALSGR